jgi:hypothetical protein
METRSRRVPPQPRTAIISGSPRSPEKAPEIRGFAEGTCTQRAKIRHFRSFGALAGAQSPVAISECPEFLCGVTGPLGLIPTRSNEL